MKKADHPDPEIEITDVQYASKSTVSAFASLGLKGELLAALTELGYEEPTPVQRAALPAMLAGHDVLAQAATGTGKTAAFALPILQRLVPGAAAPFQPTALIVVPTRELAMQVAEAIHRYGHRLNLNALPVYGGQEFSHQLRRLKRGVDVVIATPGRALDHVRRKTMKLDRVQYLVLDEADEMLDLGFADDVELLMAEVPDECQVALFSATLPPRIAALAEKHLHKPVRVRIEPEKTKAGSIPRIDQTAYVVPRPMKELALGRLLDIEAPTAALIFCRTRVEVDRLAETLSGQGYETAALHGGMTQEERERVLRRFKTQNLQLLVATDVAARGLDVEKLSHVINFDLPNAVEPYVHRIGRTGRAGREGKAITLLEPKELRLLKNIERVTGQKVTIAQMPTVMDLQARRLELTRGTIQEALTAGKVEPYRAVVERLAAEADVMDVAAAAVGALHELLNPGREDEQEIPSFEAKGPKDRKGPREGRGAAERGPRAESHAKPGGKPYDAERPGRGERSERPERSERSESRARPEKPTRTDAGKPGRPEYGRPTRPGRDGEGASRGPRGKPSDKGERGRPTLKGLRLFIGLGRIGGVRPNDLVGAIANEAGLNAREIGAIEIADHHSFVEVAEDRADEVIAALRKTKIRGRPVKVERDRRS